jgi:hypothetical protein
MLSIVYEFLIVLNKLNTDGNNPMNLHFYLWIISISL